LNVTETTPPGYPPAGFVLRITYLWREPKTVHVMHWTKEAAEDHAAEMRRSPDRHGEVDTEIQPASLTYT
jgi:hypothetical protein